MGNKYSLNMGRFPEVRTAGRTSHLDNEKCFVFDITPYSLRDRAMKLKHQKMLHTTLHGKYRKGFAINPD